MIDTGAAAEDHPQIPVGCNATWFRLPDQHIAHRIRIDRCIVPPAHIEIRHKFSEGVTPLRHRRLTARLHQDDFARCIDAAAFRFHASRCSSSAPRFTIGEMSQ